MLRSIRSFGIEKMLIVGGFAFSLLLCSWMSTYGTWQFFVPESFGDFYDAQARGLAHGHWDVPAAAISGEAYVRAGKYYGYFGPTPALMRLPLGLLFPQGYGKWSRISVCMAALVNLLVCLWLLKRAGQQREADPSFAGRALAYGCMMLLAGAASSTLFLTSRSYIYHEAIIWAGALSLLAYALLLRHLDTGGLQYLMLAFGAGLLATHARVTAGGGIVSAALLIGFGTALSHWKLRLNPLGLSTNVHVGRAIGISLGAASAIVISYFGLTQIKFRQWDGMPYHLYVQATPERLAKTGGAALRVSNIGFNVGNYFGLDGIAYVHTFPWVAFNAKLGLSLHPDARMDLCEPIGSIPSCMPMLFLLSLLGSGMVLTGSRFKTWRLPVLCSLVPGLLLLPYFVVSHRYVHDFYPWLILGGVVGLEVLLSIPRPALRTLGLLCLLAGTLLNLWASFGLALVFQREIVWGVDEKLRGQFRLFRNRVDSLFSLEPLTPLSVESLPELPASPVEGQICSVRPTGTFYWFDGEGWRYLSGADPYHFTLQIAFPDRESGVEPLVVSGTTGAADFILAGYESRNRVRLAYNHWGSPDYSSEARKIQPGTIYRLEVDFNPLIRDVTLVFEGREVLHLHPEFYPADRMTFSIGENRVGGSMSLRFTGQIRKIESSPPAVSVRP